MTDQSRKEGLVTMLRVVQDIKSQNYGLVGTSEVWNMIKKHRDIEDVPERISSYVNAAVQKVFLDLTYRATPERVCGLYNGIDLLGEEQIDGLWKNEVIARKGAPRFDLDQIAISDGRESEVKLSCEYFLPFFLEANRERITTDSEIGYIVAGVLSTEYNEVREKIDEDIRGELDDYVRNLVGELSVVNWSEEMSRKVFIESESFDRRAVAEDAFPAKGIVFRVIREQVEHRLEYRRGILSHILPRYPFGLDIRTWEDHVLLYDSYIRDIRENLGDLLKLKKGEDVPEDSPEIRQYNKDVDRSRRFGKVPDTLNERIKDLQEVLEMRVFIRRLLGQEKNWVSKVLRN